eukprot:Awhi_evm1s461
MDCGHVCRKLCHPDDESHIISRTLCLRPCPKTCKKYHPCPRNCGEDYLRCPPCKVNIDTQRLLCGHDIKDVPCHKEQSDLQCLQEVTRTYADCGHTVLQKCHKNVCTFKITHNYKACSHSIQVECCVSQRGYLDDIRCMKTCKKTLVCGHSCEEKCQNSSHVCQCKIKCKRIKGCGHICNQPCHPKGDCDLYDCVERCTLKCSHGIWGEKCSDKMAPCFELCEKSQPCKHNSDPCPLPCALPCLNICQEPCDKTLACGHVCPTLCGEICPGVEFCRVCGTEDKKNEIVDLIEMISFEESEGPVVILPCNHILSKETYEGIIGSQKSGSNQAGINDIAIDSINKTCPWCNKCITKQSLIEKLQLTGHARIKRELHNLKKFAQENPGNLNRCIEKARLLVKEAEDDPAKKLYESAIVHMGSKEKLESLGKNFWQDSQYFKYAPFYSQNLLNCTVCLLYFLNLALTDTMKKKKTSGIRSLFRTFPAQVSTAIELCIETKDYASLVEVFSEKLKIDSHYKHVDENAFTDMGDGTSKDVYLKVLQEKNTSFLTMCVQKFSNFFTPKVTNYIYIGKLRK